MTKMQRTQPLIKWALLAFATLAGFALLILVPGWLKPSLSKADLNAVPAGEKHIALQQAQGQLQNNIRTTLLQGLAGIVVVVSCGSKPPASLPAHGRAAACRGVRTAAGGTRHYPGLAARSWSVMRGIASPMGSRMTAVATWS
jgi:hypothetical protein